jgi:hypothetical protein
MAKKRRLTDEQVSWLKDVVEHFHKEDSSVRDRQIRVARQLKLFWENFQRTWYSETAHDWRVWDIQQAQGESDDQNYYDKPVNIYRAYLESLIAALSVTVPPIKCFPDDADNPSDLSTAKAGDKIAQLIFRHNDAPLLWIHALFVYMTEGMTACYSYSDSDYEYGSYDEKKYDEIEEMHEYKMCPNCGQEIDDRIVSAEADEFQPDDDDAMLHDVQYNEGMELCPQCMSIVDPELQRSPLIITRLVGTTKQPKSRQCLEVYGLLNVKVANYARKQCDTLYLEYSYEDHYAAVLEKYPDLREDKQNFGNIMGGTGGGSEPYERWARLSPQYRGEYPINNVTCREVWLRPAAFNILEEERAKKLKELFPDGAKVCLVNDEYASSCNESLDDHWTLTYNPLSDYVNFDPVGLLLVTLQDITNDLISLILQTIEHGIPQTFVDPAVLDTEAYRQLEATPGSLIPSKPISSNKKVSDGFYEVKTATLSSEILPFANMVQQLAQQVSGALPSLFGGAMQGGGETASEYSMSRAQALQRLQTTWKLLTLWWKNIFGKVIPQYMKDLVTDERDVQRNKDGSFVNVIIRRAEMEGKLGKVELEANENLPMTWNQIKDVVMKLIESGNPELLSILGSPENLPVVRDALGLTDFYLPGEDDRTAELEEITQLLNSEPMQMPPDPMMVMQAQMMGQEPPPPQEFPSVDIDQEIDNHALRFEIDRAWLVSDAGRLAKTENPPGYKNVLLHAKAHKQAMMMEQMQQAMMAPPDEKGAVPGEKPNQKDKPAPIEEEGDVATIQ